MDTTFDFYKLEERYLNCLYQAGLMK